MLQLGSTATLIIIGSLCAGALPISWYGLPETLGLSLTQAPTDATEAKVAPSQIISPGSDQKTTPVLVVEATCASQV